MTWAGAGLGAFLAVSAAGGEAAPQSREKQRREMGRIQRELEQTRLELDGYLKQEEELKEEMGQLEEKAGEAERRLNAVSGDLRRESSRRGELERRKASLGGARVLWSALLSKELRVLAGESLGRPRELETVGIWREELRRSAIRFKARHLLRLRGLEGLTQSQEAKVRARETELARLQGRWVSERAKTDSELRDQRSEMEKLDARKAQARERAAALEDSARALRRLMESLASGGTPPGRFSIPQHSLPWPVEGKIVEAFGRHKDRELDTWVIRQGVRLETSAGSPVKAMAAGRVIFAGPFRSYGRVVIVDHGTFYGVYGELGDILRAKGQQLSAGEAFAVAGPAGGHGRLYLEIRAGSEAYDPVQWLEKRKP